MPYSGSVARWVERRTSHMIQHVSPALVPSRQDSFTCDISWRSGSRVGVR